VHDDSATAYGVDGVEGEVQACLVVQTEL